MKIVIAIDSFKGSLSSYEAGNAVREGILRVIPGAEVCVLPLADGGEGTVDALMSAMGGSEIALQVTDPLGCQREAKYGILAGSGIAVIETAQAAGLTLIPPELRNPLNTTTYGVGLMILDALKRGCRDFIVGIGGSATNDGGIGMLEALGCRFLDADNEPIGPFGRDLERIAAADLSLLEPALKESRFRIACDVSNPLCGDNGASAVYGPQKGATPSIVAALDKALQGYARVIEAATGISGADTPGAGAAGGLGFAFRTVLGATLEPGISIVLDAIELERHLTGADLVVTGEGRIDGQTAMGKAPGGVADMAKKYCLPVIAFCGATGEGSIRLGGIDAVFPVLRAPCTLQEAMDIANASRNTASTAEQVFRLINTLYKS